MTIKEIAEKTNVSVATVSRVINNSANVKKETRERILQLLEKDKNNYRYFASVGNRSLAVILPDIHNSFYGEIQRGITRNANSASCNVFFYDTKDDSSDEIVCLEKAMDRKVDGILLMSSSSGDKEERLKDFLSGIKIPIVLIDREIRGLALDAVLFDDVSGILQLTGALAGCGHRKITLIAGERNSSVTKKRISGFIEALQEFNLDYSGDQVVFASLTDADISEPIISGMLARPDRPTAIISCGGLLTMTAIKCIRATGLKIGKDISLVSFDEVPALKLLGIGITSISVDFGEMGRTGFDLLIKKIGDPHTGTQKRIMVPSIFMRGSEKIDGD